MTPENLLSLNSLLLSPPPANPLPVAERCKRLWVELGAEIRTNPAPWPTELITLLTAMAAKYDVPWPVAGEDGIWRVNE